MQLRKAFITATIIAASLFSCRPKTVFFEYQHTPTDGWENEDTLTFCIPAIPEEGFYNATLGIRTTRQYPFEKISIALNQEILPDGRHLCDTINCRIVSPDGTIIGQGITLYQYEFDMPEINVRQGDSITIKLSHIMRSESIPGIADIGIRIAKN